jgi:hypothetical protein
MPSDDLFNNLIDREMTALEIMLTAKSQRTAMTLDEYISSRLAFGVNPRVIREELLVDLRTGGRIFGEFRNAIKATIRGSTMRARDIAEYAKEGVDLSYRWAAVMVNTCPDCLERHGEVKTWEEWEAEGMPRTGHTVCKEHCKCMLIPARLSVLSPIKRER